MIAKNLINESFVIDSYDEFDELLLLNSLTKRKQIV